jgi:malate/lactate dehydrogenase
MPSNFRNIVVLGFGNVGQALSSLLRKRFFKEHILLIDERMTPEQPAIAER